MSLSERVQEACAYWERLVELNFKSQVLLLSEDGQDIPALLFESIADEFKETVRSGDRTAILRTSKYVQSDLLSRAHNVLILASSFTPVSQIY